MFLLLTGKAGSYAQFIAVLLIFVIVLAVTAYSTKWIAGYQKKQGMCANMELLEAIRLGNNKYIQVVRLGEKFLALAVCKDTVTVLCEIPREEWKDIPPQTFSESFKGILEKVSSGQNHATKEPKE